MRDCSHMPGAGKDVICPLCKDIEAHGKPVTSAAFKVLNQQPPIGTKRTCAKCGQSVPMLVTRQGELMCVGCAECADEEVD